MMNPPQPSRLEFERLLRKSRKIQQEYEGFTLVELLVVVATIAILATMLLPAVADTKPDSRVNICQNNQRRLTVAWLMYAQDNHDQLVRNGSLAGQPANSAEDPSKDPALAPGGTLAQWCPGNDQNLQTALRYSDWIEAGMIYPYVQNLTTYKCPADHSVYSFGGGKPTLRTYSMNGWLGPLNGYTWNGNYVTFAKLSDMTQPGPARTWVFIEENYSTIGDGYFVVDPSAPTVWYNSPAVLHNSCSVMSFADGHTLVRRWRDIDMISGTGVAIPADPNFKDLAWFLSVSTVSK